MGRIEELEAKIRSMEAAHLKNEKIRMVLMERVEQTVASTGTAFTLFEQNILLSQKVQQRTAELEATNRELLKEIEGRKQMEKELHTLNIELQRKVEERDRLIVQRKEALDKIKTLSGLLPICSSCKKIRNDKGEWEQMEVYIRNHSEADFSHGFCRECLEKLYPEYVDNL